MNRGVIGMGGLAGLALLAASEAINRGEQLPPLKLHPPKPKAREKSESLKRMLRKAKP